ncbi:MAG: maleylpyruvate isomerase family mycothiol-dependent enzyme [Actinomycetota bacterium]
MPHPNGRGPRLLGVAGLRYRGAVESRHAFSHEAYCAALPAEVDRFAEAISAADPLARVPTCPEWTVARLADHLGSVHRWADEHVRRLSQERIPGAQIDVGTPPDPADLPAWLRAGAARLVKDLLDRDADAAVWAWGADKCVRFWSRRMIHESTIHRADAEFALAREPSIETAVAADGIDEFLENLPHATWAEGIVALRGEGERIALRSPDGEWTIRLGTDGIEWSHDAEPADAVIEASAADLYLFVWGRRTAGAPELRCSGDDDLVKRWVEATRL